MVVLKRKHMTLISAFLCIWDKQGLRFHILHNTYYIKQDNGLIKICSVSEFDWRFLKNFIRNSVPRLFPLNCLFRNFNVVSNEKQKIWNKKKKYWEVSAFRIMPSSKERQNVLHKRKYGSSSKESIEIFERK